MSEAAPPRPQAIPPECSAYRTIGPFSDATLPAGLRRTHSLAQGVWGQLSLASGSLRMVWEDGSGQSEWLAAPAQLVVPPLLEHHLEDVEGIALTIAFHRG